MRAYVEAIDSTMRPLFARVHRCIVETVPFVAVGISYGIPTYRLGHRRLQVGAWKHGLSIYGWVRSGDGGFTARYPDTLYSKGTIRLRTDRAAAIEDDALRELARTALTG